MERVVVTGGTGFIGSAVVHLLLAQTDWFVINVDKLTYAANPLSLAAVASHPRYAFEAVDIGDGAAVRGVFERHRPDAVVHLAAESHVDRSIDGPGDFIQTNVVGTFRLLETARGYWGGLSDAARAAFRFLHVSTDEVFGSLGATGAFTEDSPYRPNSPYSASKAASDHLVRAWGETYGLPVLLTNCSNNYGPRQFPEKLIPLMILKAIHGQDLPVYGRGENVRDWLHVEDHARALKQVLERGQPGQTYAIGGACERTNLAVVRQVCRLLDERLPERAPHDRLIRFVADRPGHDLRYAIDARKIRDSLGWTPRETFESGLAATVDWYLDNRSWWDPLFSRTQGGQRLGMGGA